MSQQLDKARETDGALDYPGYYKHANEEPTGDYILIFASDWLKEHWAFYAYVDCDEVEDSLEEITELIESCNFRDGDVYVEFIDRSASERVTWAYKHMMDKATWSLLGDPDTWEKHLDKDYDPDEDPDLYHAIMYPPYGDRFENRWDYTAYLTEEMGYDWETVARELLYLVGEDGARQSYDRHARQLF